MLEVGAGRGLLVLRFDPGIDIKVQASDGRMPRRVIVMMQLRPGRQIALELHPVKALDFPRAIRFDKDVHFAICYSIKDPSVCADVLHRFWQCHARRWVSLRDDDVVFDPPFRCAYFGGKTPGSQNDKGKA